MNDEALDAALIPVGQLFRDTNYTVPVYQRKYAWKAPQIEQLISDIHDAAVDGHDGYFLGNLIVTERPSIDLDYEVIDGQQRLTTLHILLTFLRLEGHHERLRYESRPRATEALRRVASELGDGVETDRSAEDDTGIHEGFNVVRQFMLQHPQLREAAARADFARYLLEDVTLVRGVLPAGTDLNRYFEIMNTRGQQLQQVDIVKARLMRPLSGDEEALACFGWIWDACADMDSYVQMSLTRGSTDLRKQLFGENWEWLDTTSFDDLVAARQRAADAPRTRTVGHGSLTLEAALHQYAARGEASSDDDPDNVRFRSTIEFPAFLLHVLRARSGALREREGELDDKQLIRHFERALATHSRSGTAREWAIKFAEDLLRYRVLFDAFVLKRQYTGSSSEEGAWSLQRLVRRTSRGRSVPGYVNSFDADRDDGEEDPAADVRTRELLLLQSMLRVTYTSPRTMHWITLLLARVGASAPSEITSATLVGILKAYAREKVREAYFNPAEEPEGFAISRVVFTYLDYLLAPKERSSEFQFTFRNSIEHFYPQHPDEHQAGDQVSPSRLHVLGNLALVSVGANSKFSNSLPRAKAENYKTTIEAQSPKLRRMAQTTRVGLTPDSGH